MSMSSSSYCRISQRKYVKVASVRKGNKVANEYWSRFELTVYEAI